MFKNKMRFTRGFGLFEHYLAKKRCEMANRLIPTNLHSGRILDIGCGTYPLFLVNTDFNEKYGIDKSDELANYTQNTSLIQTHHISHSSHSSHSPYSPYSTQPIHLQRWDFENQSELPFESGYFNVVTMLAVIEHLEPPNARQLISEIFRILQKNGAFILTTPASWTNPLLHWMACLRLVSPLEINEHKDTYSHKKISGLLQNSGFKKENIKLGYFEMFMNIWSCSIR